MYNRASQIEAHTDKIEPMKRSALFALTSFFILLASSALAQGIPSTIGGLELTTSAIDPVPGQSVTIKAASYSVDINSANLTWVSAGKTIAKGVGVTSVTVQAPALGKKISVTVTMISPDGTSFVNSITVNSGSVDLVLEPDGYVPPFFMGKAPVVYQNSVKIIAVPHIANSSGVEYDPETLVYKWQQNDTVLQDQSGYGKQSITLPGNIVPRPYQVTVTISTRDGTAQAMGITSVTAGSPLILFYRNDPLYGPLFNNAIGNILYLGAQRETGVMMVPLGFNITGNGLGDLSLSWLINGVEHPELASNESITLRAPESSSGSSNVQLSITDPKNILQQAQAGFSAVFSAASSSSASTVTF